VIETPAALSGLARRGRRLRSSDAVRDLVRETRLSTASFVYPLFVREGLHAPREIESMPGQWQHTLDSAVEEAGRALELGVSAVILFGVPACKDAQGSEAWSASGITQAAIRALKKAHRDRLLVVADLCLCEYTDHGHCGVLGARGDVDNDATLDLYQRVASSQAEAGADWIAPSGMMDGQVAAIRDALDAGGHSETGILAYGAKYASGFYGPFREAAASTPRFGDRRGYQMDPANAREAMTELQADLEQGADVLMVKPALAYLDVIRAARERFEVPIAAYNVSAEYAMVKAAAANGWIDGRRVCLEILTSIRRAGADIILSYHALEAARWLQ
jgi:porphobilinogen synthase